MSALHLKALPLNPSTDRAVLTVDSHSPDGTVVPIQRAQSLAVRREPDIHHWVLARREQQIAIPVEDDLCERSLVALENDRLLVLVSPLLLP